jgi:hypothetical protein
MVAARTPNMSLKASRVRARAGAERKSLGKADWNAKLRPSLEPEIVTDKRIGDRLLLPTPLLIGAEIAAVPSGSTIRVSQLREQLARRFGADRTCPLMTGMFIKILAGAVAEDLAQQRNPRWPVWRLVADDSTLNATWPLDALYRATRLREEGVRIGRRNSHWQVLPAASRSPA